MLSLLGWRWQLPNLSHSECQQKRELLLQVVLRSFGIWGASLVITVTSEMVRGPSSSHVNEASSGLLHWSPPLKKGESTSNILINAICTVCFAWSWSPGSVRIIPRFGWLRFRSEVQVLAYELQASDCIRSCCSEVTSFCLSANCDKYAILAAHLNREVKLLYRALSLHVVLSNCGKLQKNTPSPFVWLWWGVVTYRGCAIWSCLIELPVPSSPVLCTSVLNAGLPVSVPLKL